MGVAIRSLVSLPVRSLILCFPFPVGRALLCGCRASRRTTASGKPRVGVLITMDFEQLDKYKECSAGDYEDWEPSTEGCLLGQTLSLQRQVRPLLTPGHRACWDQVGGAWIGKGCASGWGGVGGE